MEQTVCPLETLEPVPYLKQRRLELVLYRIKVCLLSVPVVGWVPCHWPKILPSPEVHAEIEKSVEPVIKVRPVLDGSMFLKTE